MPSQPKALSPELAERVAAQQRVQIENCAADPCFYAFNHVRTIDPHDDQRPVKRIPYLPYIEYVLNTLVDDSEAAEYFLKSRQVMMSWTVMIFVSWLCRFTPHRHAFVQSKKDSDAADMVYNKKEGGGRLNQIETNLPAWLRPWFCTDREHMNFERGVIEVGGAEINYPNHSYARGIPQGKAQIEGQVPSFFFSDESSLQKEFLAVMAAVAPAVAGKSKICAIGTSRPPSEFNTALELSDQFDDKGQPMGAKDAWEEVSPGVYTYRTRSGVRAHGIHYSADPDKDPETEVGEAWRSRQAKAYPEGINDVRWKQHMEMDLEAYGGDLVFEFWRPRRNTLVVPVMRDYSQIRHWPMFAGFDYGKRNLTCGYVIAVDPATQQRRIIKLVEGAGHDLGGHKGIARRMIKHPLFAKVNGKIDADPSIWNDNQSEQTRERYTSIAKLLANEGVRLRKAKYKGQVADDVFLERTLHHYWADPERPLMVVEANCTHLIQQFGALRYEEWTPALREQHGEKETLVDRYNDSWDALKYAETRMPDVQYTVKQAFERDTYGHIMAAHRRARRSQSRSRAF